MTSLFEHAEGGANRGVPVDLIALERRSVALMEFLPVWDGPKQGATIEGEDAGATREAQVRLMIDAARSEAKTEARLEFEQELLERLAEERTRVQRLCVEFARDRQQFFAAAEVQVVRLALAVASRVLSREIAGETMYLQATVRAALARVQDGSAMRLCVASGEAAAWRAMFAKQHESGVEVVGDERLAAGDCALWTSVGCVDLGVKVQMEEIGRGFEELMPRFDAGEHVRRG